MLRKNFCGEIDKHFEGKKVEICGWVRNIRHKGNIAFLVLHDITGDVQIVVENKDLLEKVKKINLQYVLKIKGKVRKRPPKDINPDMKTGEIEVEVEEIQILNTTPPPPFLPEDINLPHEEIRLRWRFLDLRRPSMQRNIITRSKIMQIARQYLLKNKFIEIETPYLTKSTPEGARDFLVPSRLLKGKFYALPQSPQLYKQILMSSGFERYFQFARCFRDEDLRADRQPEFTQLDIEISFIEEKDIFELIEKMFYEIWKEILNVEIEIPFKKLTYKEALEKYGTDKPDLRNGIELKDFTYLFKDTNFRIFREIIERGGKVIGIEHGGNITRGEIKEIEEAVKGAGGGGVFWVKKADNKLSGPGAKFLNKELLKENATYLFIADTNLKKLYQIGGILRENLIKKQSLEGWKFVWVTKFPLFEFNEENQIEPMHHMFTMPEDIELFEKFYEAYKKGDRDFIENSIEKLTARQYDLVLNGVELGSGSIRIHKKELQLKVFEILGYTKEEVEKRFGFLLEALEYGAPPHGGIALGFDRIVAMILKLESIRDVIPFPKTTSGQALFEKAPSEVEEEQLKELGIKIADK